MTHATHKYAIDAAADGLVHLLYHRTRVPGDKAIAATTWPDRRNPQPFASAEAAITYAKANLGARDEDFAPHPGQP